MPRIDPERLLKCLVPLLDNATGGIKSSDEVDKILGLMSKFSKKLVSKCIYMNILRASHVNVVDLFMHRGGWNLVFGWTNEAVVAKNYPLLKEILQLLLQLPITVARLKENKFPVLLKNLSKDCEDLDTRNLSKQVVGRWFSIAKGEENQQLQPLEYQVGNLGLPVDHVVANHSGAVHELGHLNVTADSLLNIDPSFIPDAAENQLLDFEISNTDLSTIDFNLDILSKVVDEQPQPLEEALSEINSTTGLVPSIGGVHMKQELPTNVVFSNSNANAFSIPNVNNATLIQQQQHQPVKQEVIDLIQVQSAPKIYIKTIAGQRTVVQGLGSEPGQYCLLIKGDKNYVVKVKEPSASVAPVLAQPVQVPEATSSGIKTEDASDSGGKVKRSKLHKKEKEPKISSTSKSSSGSPKLKTYGSSKPNPATSKDSQVPSKKPSDQSSKPGKPDKEKKPKESGVSEGHRKSKSSSSRSKAEAAAAVAAKQLKEKEKDDELRRKIREEKAQMKKRAKDAEKQKQQEKDQETLKKLNLAPPSSTSQSTGLKIPKIPKKNTSFIDAIGIPGSDGVISLDKIKTINSDKEKSNKSGEDSVTPLSPTKKTPGKKDENEPNDSEQPKERRHKPKVYVRSKSRADDLLKDMEAGKNKPSKEKEKEKAKDEPKPATSLGNSIPAVPPKVSKRLSTDTIEKPGDPKKAKLVDGSTKTEKAKEAKESAKEKEKKKPTIALKESSLFMDMLTAAETKPSKRKRRLSTGNEKSELPSPIEKSPKSHNNVKEENQDISEVQDETVIPEKPVFNFYRETLNDSPEEDNNEEKAEQSSEIAPSADEPMEQDTDDRGSFTPQENDGKLKSALCLIRPRNRPKKSVKWKDDETLKEFHYFEMDETERVNVTKQKGFTEMSQNEKAMEGSFLKHKTEEEEQQNRWRLFKIDFQGKVSNPPITSQEKSIQEERERNVLGLFLPPGAARPDTASEPDPTSPIDRIEPKFIPVEDVNSITKVSDFRTHSWPQPKGFMPLSFNVMPQEMEHIMPQNPVLNPFPPVNDYNPWSTPSFPPVPAPIPVQTISDLSPFQHFPPPSGLNINMNFLGGVPPATVGFANQNPFAFPPPMVPQVNGPSALGTMDPFNSNNNNREGRLNSNRGGRFNDSDHRSRTFHGRERDAGARDRGGNRDRDYRDDRGGRDRDYRRRGDRDNRDNNDRDHRHHDRERSNRDHRSGSSGRTGRVQCRYFKNGNCTNGSRCGFLHDDDSKTSSRHDSHESSRSRRSPDSHSKDVDLRQSSLDDDWDNDSSSSKPTLSSEADAPRFELPPSSPTEPEMPVFAASAESTKVIPV